VVAAFFPLASPERLGGDLAAARAVQGVQDHKRRLLAARCVVMMSYEMGHKGRWSLEMRGVVAEARSKAGWDEIDMRRSMKQGKQGRYRETLSGRGRRRGQTLVQHVWLDAPPDQGWEVAESV